MVFVLEKSRQFWANIFGNTMCRSFLKRTSASCFFSVIIPPEDAVISVANHEKAEQSVGDMDVKDKVQWIFLPHNQHIDTCVFWLYIKVLFFNSATVFESLSMTSLIVWTVGWAWGDAVSQVRFRSVPLVQDSFKQNIFCFWNHVLFPNINASPFLNQIKQALQLVNPHSMNCQLAFALFWIRPYWFSKHYFFHKRKICKIMANVEQAGFAQNLTSQWNIGKTTKKE